MNEKEKKQHIDKFNKDVAWLKANVPRDDIYEFAEQALMAADFLIGRLNEWVDVVEECEDDKILEAWVKNIMGIRILRERERYGFIDTELKDII
jgi:hypothetical protein